MLMTQWLSKNLPCVMIGTLGLGILEDWYMICKPFSSKRACFVGVTQLLGSTQYNGILSLYLQSLDPFHVWGPNNSLYS